MEYMIMTFGGNVEFFSLDTSRNLADQLVEIETELGVPVIYAEAVA